MTEPAISCVVPVFNGADLVGEAVASLMAQTLPPAEIVVVDDGSTDGSAAAAREAGDGRLRVVRRANGGQARARNAGLAAARCGLISFLDHDDLAPPGRLAGLAAALRPEEAGVFGTWRNFWAPGLEREAEDPANAHLTGVQAQLSLTAGLIRASAFRAVGPFEPAFGNYCDLRWLLAARAKGLVFGRIGAPALERRIHRRNISRTKSTDELFEALRLWRREAG